ncbi:MAG TPA: gephyrin-like molybdotransferase Glp [Candidatus Deferrimicrobiaceae bacterium]|nr:gephyrin-like molybdotransferase Glp [Candidatus Deferrimicrobiaceae bacterium]
MTVKDMLGRSGVVSREDALRVLNEHFVMPGLSVEEITISSALGRVLASGIVSPSDLPEFDRSTMDGYAVRSADTFGAAESRPALLNVVGEILMGTVAERGIGKGEAMKIATGGALPSGADAVVMFEQTQPVDASSIEVVKAVGPGENMVRAGDDIKRGEVVLSPGHRMRPQDMSALASLGITRIEVFARPRVAIISTGNEIVPADTVPGPGRIRDSNSYNLEGLITQAGGVPVRKGIIPDDYARLRDALDTAIRDCAIVLMTGGSSVGTADLTAKVISGAGKPGVLVHGVSIKPGKPLVVGIVGEPQRHVPVFGLPGHPAAVSICFDLFTKPVLARLTGEVSQPALEGVSPNRAVKARLSRSIPSSPGREDHVRVSLEKRDDGLWAKPIFGASGLISTLVKAVGTVVVPVNKIGIEAGEEVEVRLF